MSKRRQSQLRSLYQGMPLEDLMAAYKVAGRVGGKVGAEHRGIIEEIADPMWEGA